MDSSLPRDDDKHRNSPPNESEALAENTEDFRDQTHRSDEAFDALLAESFREIGPYKLLQEIGVGGMGAVWLAEQKRPVRRRVAVKLVKVGRVDKQVIARFDAERQALSMMDHPNIAKVLDAGTADGGTPYFVMELVQGDPITKYCDQNRLSTHQRLELFIPICEAIQHAHQKGIIHRDLKPSNVMVQIEEGRPVAKVIDFGLAKALRHQTKLTDKTIFTEFGQIVGTVQYMSPEQSCTDAIDIDTRSDIYSLGVMLYELMAGSTPLEEETIHQHAILQLLEIVRDQEPPRPSQRLSSSSEKLESISEQRNEPPAKLQQILRGDLDWITMKALEKDRTRRYATANDFADDIRRYLRGEAVVARPPTPGYLVRKFVRKHRTLVGIVALFMALLTAGIAATTTFALRANRARQEAEASRRVAEISAKRSADVLQVVTDAFESVDPASGSDATMMAKDVLLQAQSSLENSELDAEGRMSLLSKLTNCFLSIGEYDAAVLTSEETVRLCAAKLGEEHPDTLVAMNNLARAYNYAGRREEAIPIYEQTLERRMAILGGEHMDTLVSMGNLALAYQSAGRLEEATQLHEETLRMMQSTLGDTDPRSLTAMNNLGRAYRNAGRLDEALVLLQQALETRVETLGEAHPQTLVSMGNLAQGYRKVGRLEDAIPLLEKTLQLMKAKLGEYHPHTLTAMGDLAETYRSDGRSAEAILYGEQLVALRKSRLGVDHIQTLKAMNNLGLAYNLAGRSDKAVPLYEQVLEACIPAIGENDFRTLLTMHNLSSAYVATGRFSEAEEILRKCLRIRQEQDPDSVTTFDTQSDYGEILLQLGRIEDAAAPLLEGYEGLERIASSAFMPSPREELADALLRLVKLAEEQQKPQDIAKWQQKLDALEDGVAASGPAGK